MSSDPANPYIRRFRYRELPLVYGRTRIRSVKLCFWEPPSGETGERQLVTIYFQFLHPGERDLLGLHLLVRPGANAGPITMNDGMEDNVYIRGDVYFVTELYLAGQVGLMIRSFELPLNPDVSNIILVNFMARLNVTYLATMFSFRRIDGVYKGTRHFMARAIKAFEGFTREVRELPLIITPDLPVKLTRHARHTIALNVYEILGMRWGQRVTLIRAIDKGALSTEERDQERIPYSGSETFRELDEKILRA